MSDRHDDGRDAQHSETNDARRRFLAGSAAALGTAALGAGFAVQPTAAGGDEQKEETETPPGAVTDEKTFEDDVAVLNYALTLEYLEAEFYRRGLDNIGADELATTEPISKLGHPVQDKVYAELRTIQEHEETHAETISAVIEQLGGEPVDAPTFDFGAATEDPAAFIATAAVLEDTGVAAYAGVAPVIENAELVPPALSIHSVEARHASFVRILGGETGFPEAFDDPLPPATVLDRASQFIVDEATDCTD